MSSMHLSEKNAIEKDQAQSTVGDNFLGVPIQVL